MKKLLLTIFAAVAMGMVASATEPVAINFSTGTPFTAVPDTTITFSEVPVHFENTNTYIAGYNGSNYLMLKSGAVPGAVSFSLPQESASFVIRTTSNCSENAGNKVTVFAGETELATLSINKHEADFTIDAGAPVAAGTVIRIAACGSRNSQIHTFTCNPPSSEPQLATDIESLAFVAPLNGSQTKNVVLRALNVTENIAVTFDNAAFSSPKDSYTAAEVGEGIEVVFTPRTSGNIVGKATFSVAGLTLEIPLSGFTASAEGTETSPLSVSDVIAMNNANAGPFWVRGVVLDKGCANAVDGVLQTGDAVATNLVLDEDGAIIPVALPAGEVRTALNIVDNPQNIGATILVYGTLERYFSAPGVKNVKEFKIEAIAGIGNITVGNTDAPVEYINLQGIRIDNPTNGSVVIRRQGSDVRKLIVR